MGEKARPDSRKSAAQRVCLAANGREHDHQHRVHLEGARPLAFGKGTPRRSHPLLHGPPVAGRSHDVRARFRYTRHTVSRAHSIPRANRFPRRGARLARAQRLLADPRDALVVRPAAAGVFRRSLPADDRTLLYLAVYEAVLVIPLLSIAGVWLAARLRRRGRHGADTAADPPSRPPVNWWALGGGGAFALVSAGVGLTTGGLLRQPQSAWIPNSVITFA